MTQTTAQENSPNATPIIDPIEALNALQNALDQQQAAGQAVVSGKKTDNEGIKKLVGSKIETGENGVIRLAELEADQKKKGDQIQSTEKALQAARARGISENIIEKAQQAIDQLKKDQEELGKEHRNTTSTLYQTLRDLKVFGWTPENNGSDAVKQWAAQRMGRTAEQLRQVTKDLSELRETVTKLGLDIDLSRTDEILNDANTQLADMQNRSAAQMLEGVDRFLRQANGALRGIVALETRIQRQEAAGQEIKQEAKGLLAQAKVAFSARRFQPRRDRENGRFIPSSPDNPSVQEAVSAAFDLLPAEQDQRMVAALSGFQPRHDGGGRHGGRRDNRSNRHDHEDRGGFQRNQRGRGRH